MVSGPPGWAVGDSVGADAWLVADVALPGETSVAGVVGVVSGVLVSQAMNMTKSGKAARRLKNRTRLENHMARGTATSIGLSGLNPTARKVHLVYQNKLIDQCELLGRSGRLGGDLTTIPSSIRIRPPEMVLLDWAGTKWCT